MSQYETIREEFHNLQRTGELEEERMALVEIVQEGRLLRGDALPFGLNGVCIYKRKDGTLICEEAFVGGAVDGYARYFNKKGQLVGEDYYLRGGVLQTRVYA